MGNLGKIKKRVRELSGTLGLAQSKADASDLPELERLLYGLANDALAASILVNEEIARRVAQQ